MSLSRPEVEHIARLAHVGLRPDEIDEMTSDLSQVIGHINRLRQVDTDGIEPTAHVADLDSVVRDDVARESWNPLAVLANAPRAEDAQFVVRAVLD